MFCLSNGRHLQYGAVECKGTELGSLYAQGRWKSPVEGHGFCCNTRLLHSPQQTLHTLHRMFTLTSCVERVELHYLLALSGIVLRVPLTWETKCLIKLLGLLCGVGVLFISHEQPHRLLVSLYLDGSGHSVKVYIFPKQV